MQWVSIDLLLGIFARVWHCRGGSGGDGGQFAADLQRPLLHSRLHRTDPLHEYQHEKGQLALKLKVI